MRRSPYFFAGCAVGGDGGSRGRLRRGCLGEPSGGAGSQTGARGQRRDRRAHRALYSGGLRQAQAEGDPILVAIHARWCPTCAAQEPIIQKIAAEGDAKNLRVLLVDFDTQKDVVKQFGATMQSTMVMFHGKDEMARTVGDTDANSIRSSVRRTLI